MKTLMQAVDEWESAVDVRQRKLEMAMFILSPKFCSKCHKFVDNQDELICLYHTGMCSGCDHVEVNP